MSAGGVDCGQFGMMTRDHEKDVAIEKLISESRAQKEELEVELVKRKKLCDNLKVELEDFKYQIETNSTSADEIERKRKNYKIEIGRLQKALGEESAMREKLKRDNDKIFSEKLLLEKELKVISAMSLAVDVTISL